MPCSARPPEAEWHIAAGDTAVLNGGPAGGSGCAAHRALDAPGPKASPRIRRAIGALGTGDVPMVVDLGLRLDDQYAFVTVLSFRKRHIFSEA